jgi:S-(hydroxymethyl)glutathione dehydrogenase/alcohol dehydrogenase
MKAAILVEQDSPLLIADVEFSALAVGQALVRIEYSSLCGKQLDEISGKRGRDPFLPHLLGHEGAGSVVAVGPGVSKVKTGDRVVLHWMKGSGIESATPKFLLDGVEVNAGWITTFSEYTVVSENRLTPFAADVDFDVAALLGCAVTTGLGIVFNDADLRPGQSIVVFGAGGVGLNVLQGAALVNAYPIVAVDLYPPKLDWAVNFDATHAVDGGSADLEQKLMELSGGRGFDVAVDTTGRSEVLQSAYRLTTPTGTTIMAGVLHHQEPITIDAFPLHFGRRLIGSHGGATKPDTDIPRYLQLYKLGKLKLREQITHRFPLAEINRAVEVARKGEAGKCVISMSAA